MYAPHVPFLRYVDVGAEECTECEEEEDDTWVVPQEQRAQYGAAIVAMTRDGMVRWSLKLQGNND